MEKNRKLIPFIFFLQKYYNNDFSQITKNDWLTSVNVLLNEQILNEEITKGLNLIKNASDLDCINMKYDFNKLFVGPGTLLAPPYESCYLNPEKVLMQQVTLRVRKAYKDAGLVITNKNIEPDDFLAYELEFLLFLLSDNKNDYKYIFNTFMDKHLTKWYLPHIKDIRNNCENPIILGMSYILEGVIKTIEIQG